MKISFVCLAALFCALVACEQLLPQAPEPETILAGPVEGLSQEQLNTHLRGDAEFARIFGEDEGLGPVFIAASCESCHGGDGKGHPVMSLTRFGQVTASGFDPLRELGGPQLQHRAIAGYTGEVIPAEANGIAKFIAPAVTGLGYLESVPDSVLMGLADPNDLDGDGISGVLSWVDAPAYFVPASHHITQGGKYIGRFGKKAGAITLQHQVTNAYKQDMGISSWYEPEDIFNPLAAGNAFDAVADPELPASVVNNVVFYMRTLKAPQRRDVQNAEVVQGEALFLQIGCGSCHLPEMQTGDSEVSALHRAVFHPYTDLLLHDMGTDLDDGYTEGSATGSEWRTAPLWGIGLAEDSQGGAAYYLHDGRVTTLEGAISYHGGEGSNSRDAFNALSADEKNKIILFLKSL